MWRELVVRPYRIVYRIRKDIVMVGAVIDGRRDLEDLLLERLTRNP
jgi:toxin ParE1/3/4